MYFAIICYEFSQTNAAWIVHCNVSCVLAVVCIVVGQTVQQVIISDETDTQTTIQRLCERIHQLEAVSSATLARCCLL